MKERCCGEVWGGLSFRGTRCTRAGKLEHEGKLYCSAHHPPTVEAKNKVKREKWDIEFAESRDRHKRDALAHKLLAAYTTDELERAVAVELVIPPTETVT